MIIDTPFKVMEAKEKSDPVQIAEFSTYKDACLYVEYLLPKERIPCCSILEVQTVSKHLLFRGNQNA
jgi:hypothetical protein